MPRSTKVRRSCAPQKRQGFKAACCEVSEVSVLVAMEFSLILGKKSTPESRAWDGFPHRQVILTERKKRKSEWEAVGKELWPDRLPPRESQSELFLQYPKGNRGAKRSGMN